MLIPQDSSGHFYRQLFSMFFFFFIFFKILFLNVFHFCFAPVFVPAAGPEEEKEKEKRKRQIKKERERIWANSHTLIMLTHHATGSLFHRGHFFLRHPLSHAAPSAQPLDFQVQEDMFVSTGATWCCVRINSPCASISSRPKDRNATCAVQDTKSAVERSDITPCQ